MPDVRDNFLDQHIHQQIMETMLSEQFPWFYNAGVVDKKTTLDDVGMDYQFTHRFFDGTVGSNYFDLIAPLLNALDYKALIRVKANLNPTTVSVHCPSGYHTDQSFECKTALYYINTNDGWTEFESGAKIESIANRLVVFDTLTDHRGVTCCDKSVRCLININYF